jgi:hypothetical protein
MHLGEAMSAILERSLGRLAFRPWIEGTGSHGRADPRMRAGLRLPAGRLLVRGRTRTASDALDPMIYTAA